MTALSASAVHIATIQIPELVESSGVVASRRMRDVYWTHNDDRGPVLYSFDRSGRARGAWRVSGARCVDWEDIAYGPGPNRGSGYLYVGDIGDNNRIRKQLTIYSVEEPQISSFSSEERTTKPATAIHVRYPDGAHDAETLMVHPSTGDIYIVTKARGDDEETAVYKLSAPYDHRQVKTLKRVATLDLPEQSPLTLLIGRITGGDISPDGKSVALCDYLRGYRATIGSGNFDDVWKSSWQTLDVGQRRQGEALCYRADGKALLTTSEGGSPPLLEVILQ